MSVFLSDSIANWKCFNLFQFASCSLYRWFIIGSIVNGSNEQSYEYTWLTDIYFMPWARIHVYMIGMLTGYYFYVSKGKIKIPKVCLATLFDSYWLIHIICKSVEQSLNSFSQRLKNVYHFVTAIRPFYFMSKTFRKERFIPKNYVYFQC